MIKTRGYFGIGVERVSKPMNIGNLMRSANAFGAHFFFTINSPLNLLTSYSDTSDSKQHVPLWQYKSVDKMHLPEKCILVGVEFCDNAIYLPTFPHPLSAAYILGPERGSLSSEISKKCSYLVKIPTKFCINVGVAGAIVMYDRMLYMGKFGDRALSVKPSFSQQRLYEPTSHPKIHGPTK
tara:strand:- start:2956 stop:3498 length:543 start_codon:yes stop_codon:yes gene_type:complete